jgi:hypothetical protein
MGAILHIGTIEGDITCSAEVVGGDDVQAEPLPVRPSFGGREPGRR